MNARAPPSMSAGPPGPRQEVVSLPLAPHIRSKLLAAGFRTLADLEGIGPVDLSRGGCGAASRYKSYS